MPARITRVFYDVWEPGTFVRALSDLGEDPFVQGKVREVKVQQTFAGELQFVVQVSLNNLQPKNDRDVREEFANFQDGGIAIVHPIPPPFAQDKLDCFRCNEPSRIMLEETPRGRIKLHKCGMTAIHLR